MGAFWDSFELFGSLWDLPWESLGPLSGILGSLLGLLGLVGPLLGCSFGLSSALLDSLGLLLGVPFRTSWPKRRPGSDKVPQDSPKSRPRDPQGSQNGPPKSVNFMSFLCFFFTFFRDSFSEGFLDAWPLKICDFAWEVLQKRCFPQVTSKSEKDRKSNEKGFQNLSENSKNGFRKWDQFWKHLGVLSWDALGTMTRGEDATTSRAGGLRRGREGLKTLPRGLGKGLWKELFVLVRSELRLYTP